MRMIEIESNHDLNAAIATIVQPSRDEAAAERETRARDAVQAVLAEVRARGDEAVAEFTERFDKVRLAPEDFEVPAEDVERAAASVDPALVATLERAHANILRFHEKNLRSSWEETSGDGTILGQRIGPIDSAGLYVPGGKAFYPSSVLMNIVPAKVAGVRNIVMVSPPSYRGGLHPLVLTAARIAGATRIFRIGGAQAIAALAYGTQHIPAVSKIAGPGNVYVTLAKRFVAGVCAIDKEAGPSEVVVIADEATNPRLAAAELLAQAEHEDEARAILVVTSRAKAEAILAAAEQEMKTLARAAIIRAAFAKGGLVYVVRTMADAAAITNAIAPEHLAIQTNDPRAVFDTIEHAGCCVLGEGTAVACGDYFAGPNHILPTSRSARYASPLTAEDFRKVTSVLAYSPERMRRDADDIVRLAMAEELSAHARAVEIRR